MAAAWPRGPARPLARPRPVAQAGPPRSEPCAEACARQRSWTQEPPVQGFIAGTSPIYGQNAPTVAGWQLPTALFEAAPSAIEPQPRKARQPLRDMKLLAS